MWMRHMNVKNGDKEKAHVKGITKHNSVRLPRPTQVRCSHSMQTRGVSLEIVEVQIVNLFDESVSTHTLHYAKYLKPIRLGVECLAFDLSRGVPRMH